VSKPEEKRRAIELRRQGLSYREILEQVPVAKATLSLWLRSVGLSQPQRQRLAEKKLAAARRGAKELRRERLVRAARTMAAAELEAARYLADRDLLWAVGAALYWAEGFKPKPWRPGIQVGIANTDVRVIDLFRKWVIRYGAINASDLAYALQIHEQADIAAAMHHWMGRLDLTGLRVPVRLKRHNPSPGRKNVGREYYGTMQLTVRRSTQLNHRIAGWIQALAGHWGVG
jgi:hypothetical protein